MNCLIKTTPGFEGGGGAGGEGVLKRRLNRGRFRESQGSNPCQHKKGEGEGGRRIFHVSPPPFFEPPSVKTKPHRKQDWGRRGTDGNISRQLCGSCELGKSEQALFRSAPSPGQATPPCEARDALRATLGRSVQRRGAKEGPAALLLRGGEALERNARSSGGDGRGSGGGRARLAM